VTVDLCVVKVWPFVTLEVFAEQYRDGSIFVPTNYNDISTAEVRLVLRLVRAIIK